MTSQCILKHISKATIKDVPCAARLVCSTIGIEIYVA